MGMLFIAALLFRVRLAVAVGYGLGSAPGQDPGPRALHHWGHGCNKHRDPKNTISPKEHNRSSAAHALCLKSDSVNNNFHLVHYSQDGCYLLSRVPINNLIPSCKVERHLVLPHVKHSLSFIELNSSLVYCMRTSSHSHIAPWHPLSLSSSQWQLITWYLSNQNNL